MSSLRQDASKGVIWSFIENYSVQGVQFFIGIIMARILSPNDYGLIGMLAIFMSLSQVFIDGGFSTALIQKKDRSESDLSTVFYTNLLISSFIYVLLFVAAPFIADFYDQPLLVSITRIYALNLIINSFAAVHKTILVINVDFKTQSKISFFSACISGCIGVYFAYSGFEVWALVIQMLVSALLNVVLCYWWVRWRPQGYFSKKSFRSLFSFGSKILIATIVSNIYVNLYSLVIGKRFSSADLGYYTRANQFASLVGDNTSRIITRVSLPILSKIQDDDERLVSVYRKYLKCSVFLIFPAMMLLCGIAKPLVLLLLTEKWSPCILLLQILCFNYFWSPVTSINLNLLYVKGRSDLILRLEILKKSVAFTILFVSCFFSLEWVCAGLAIYSFIAIIFNTYYTGRLLNYGFFTQMSDILPILLLSVIVLGCSLSISYFVSNSLLAIILSAVISIAIYILIAFITKMSELSEFISIVKQKKNGKF